MRRSPCFSSTISTFALQILPMGCLRLSRISKRAPHSGSRAPVSVLGRLATSDNGVERERVLLEPRRVHTVAGCREARGQLWVNRIADSKRRRPKYYTCFVIATPMWNGRFGELHELPRTHLPVSCLGWTMSNMRGFGSSI